MVVKNRSLTLREECRIRVFENKILRRIFGPKRDENGEWRRFISRSYNKDVPVEYIITITKGL